MTFCLPPRQVSGNLFHYNYFPQLDILVWSTPAEAATATATEAAPPFLQFSRANKRSQVLRKLPSDKTGQSGCEQQCRLFLAPPSLSLFSLRTLNTPARIVVNSYPHPKILGVVFY